MRRKRKAKRQPARKPGRPNRKQAPKRRTKSRPIVRLVAWLAHRSMATLCGARSISDQIRSNRNLRRKMNRTDSAERILKRETSVVSRHLTDFEPLAEEEECISARVRDGDLHQPAERRVDSCLTESRRTVSKRSTRTFPVPAYEVRTKDSEKSLASCAFDWASARRPVTRVCTRLRLDPALPGERCHRRTAGRPCRLANSPP